MSFRDRVAIIGFISFLTGIGLWLGLAATLIVFGVSLMAGATWVEWNEGRKK